MFKSLFSKYITIFIAIIFTGFLILTSVMTYLVSSYASKIKYENLGHIANSMSFFLSREYEFNANNDGVMEPVTDYSEKFNEAVDMLAVESDEITVFVTSKDDKVIAYGSSAKTPLGEFFKTEASDTLFSDNIVSTLRGGSVVKDMGMLDGALDDYRVSVGVPIFDSENVYSGAVFVSTINTGVDSLAETMMMTLIMASLCLMLASLFAVYFITIRLTKPLRDMSVAAKEFSKGNFDVTIPVVGEDEISNLAESFNDLSKSLKDLDYMRSSFISSVSHELRTPMTTIGGFIDSMLDGRIPPEQERHYLEVISGEVKRLARLVTSLLEISRMESGQKQMVFTDFDICEMARIILISNEQRLEEKKLDVSFVCDEDRMFVSADKDSIHQILYNLCDNAIKFSYPEGKYEISLRYKDDKVQISVFNEGEGISEQDLPHVFDRFFKSDKSRGLDKTGVGLGLYITRSIIVYHGEDIKVESDHGKWCRFTFTLPRAKRNGTR